MVCIVESFFLERGSDACTTGGAAFYNGDWLYANWSIDYPEVQNAHINIKELFTVLLAFRRWGDHCGKISMYRYIRIIK